MITRCVMCEKYLMEDGTWGEPDLFELYLMMKYAPQIKEDLCPECGGEQCEESNQGFLFQDDYLNNL